MTVSDVVSSPKEGEGTEPAQPPLNPPLNIWHSATLDISQRTHIHPVLRFPSY